MSIRVQLKKTKLVFKSKISKSQQFLTKNLDIDSHRFMSIRDEIFKAISHNFEKIFSVYIFEF